MDPIQGPVAEHSAESKRSKARGRTPVGCRVLYAYVPEPIFNHAKAQALLSGMRFTTEYLTRLLSEAQPYPPNRLPNCKEQLNPSSTTT